MLGVYTDWSVDYAPSRCRFKIFIIDETLVLTGSYNFTDSAELRNAENLLIITNDELAQKYLTNFWNHFEHSEAVK